MFKWVSLLGEWVWKACSYKSRIEKKMDFLIEQAKDNKLELLRLKFLHFVEHKPTEVVIICSIFDEYKSLGGDSWVDDIYLAWKKKIAKGGYKRSQK